MNYRGYNGRKKHVISKMLGRGWMRPGDVCIETHLWPIRSMYSYLKRLWKMKLLNRRHNGGKGGPLLYKVSKRGQDRLVWLRSEECAAMVKRKRAKWAA